MLKRDQGSGRRAALALSVLGFAAAIPAQARPIQQAVLLSPADAKAAQQLCLLMTASVAKLPRSASTQDIEAAIVFTISQKKAPPSVVTAALKCVRGTGQNFRVALANVGRGYNIGTASITDAGGSFGNGGGGNASTPVIGIGGGGGGSNYTPG